MDDTDTVGLFVLLVALVVVFIAARWSGRESRPTSDPPNGPATTLLTQLVPLLTAGFMVPLDRRQRMGSELY
jgi:hypothetical protein